MKSLSFIKKTITLISSISLVVLFLYFRSGSFDSLPEVNTAAIQSSSNGGVINTVKKSTFPEAKKDTGVTSFPSTDSFQTPDNPRLRDSLLPWQKIRDSIWRTQPSMLYSSKSGAILTPSVISNIVSQAKFQLQVKDIKKALKKKN